MKSLKVIVQSTDTAPKDGTFLTEYKKDSEKDVWDIKKWSQVRLTGEEKKK